jgi:hypothetical protein
MRGIAIARRDALAIAAIWIAVAAVLAGGIMPSTALGRGPVPPPPADDPRSDPGPEIIVAESSCTEGGAVFRFVAPNAGQGTAGPLTVTYTVGGQESVVTVGESTVPSGSAHWWLRVFGLGEITITSATAGSYSWQDVGPATVVCEAGPADS